MLGVASRLSWSAQPTDGSMETKSTVAASSDHRICGRKGTPPLVVLPRGSVHYPLGIGAPPPHLVEPITRGDTQSSPLTENRLSFSLQRVSREHFPLGQTVDRVSPCPPLSE